MLNADDGLQQALRTHQIGGVRGAAFYRGQMTTAVPIAPSGNIEYNGDSEIQSSGTVRVVGQAPSLVPRSMTDPLSTFGQELALWRTVEAAGRMWEVPLGRFRITEVQDSVEYRRGDTITAYEVELVVRDRFDQIKADDFLEATSPVAGASAYAELRRLSPIPVQESLPDRTVPAATVYDTRLGAIEVVCDILGGSPHLTRDGGVLTVRPKDAWLTETEPVFDIAGVITWGEQMSNDWANQVQVKASNNNDLVAYRSITDPSNPMHPANAGGRTFKHSAPIYETQEAVDAAADTILARVSTRGSRIVDVSCGPEAMLLEIGDVGWVRDPLSQRAAFGEVLRMAIPLDPTVPVSLTLIVAKEP